MPHVQWEIPRFAVYCQVRSTLVNMQGTFCEARRASHCHSPQTTFSSNSTCCVLSTQKSVMHVVVDADRLTTQHSIVDIVDWSWKLLVNLVSQMTCRMLLAYSRCTLNFVCFTYHCFATTSTAENSTIQGRLKPSHKRLLRVNVSSHRHMT